MSRSTDGVSRETWTRVTRRCAIVVVVAFGLNGCGADDDEKLSTSPELKPNGIEDLEPAAAIREAADATRYVRDLTLEGTGPFPFEDGPIQARVRILVTKMGDCEVAMRSKRIGTITTRQIGQTSYLRAGVDGWTVGFGAPAGVARLFAGKWISRPSGDGHPACSIHELSAQSIDPDTCTGGDAGEVDGTPTLAFACEESGDPVTVEIATVGDPLAYRLSGADEDGPFDLRLVDHDSGEQIPVPPRRSVIDGTQLQP